MNVVITGQDLTLEKVVDVARNGAKVSLSPQAKENVLKSRKVVDDIIEQKKVVYGVTTGFGSFCNTVIPTEESKVLQKNLIITHAVGAGEAFPTEVARAVILLRINNLAKGFSGIRMETLETLIAILNKGVTPIIPEKGSLGASGDLAPLSHMVLPIIGLGKAEFEGKIYDGAEAMKLAGIPTVELTEKEGLALINGTQVMTAVGVLTMYDSINLLKTADIAAAMSFEAQNGVIDALQPRMHTCRPHQGQIDSARIISSLLEGSKNVTKQGEIKVQDAYSLRCAPQVHGASKDALNYVKEQIEIEINSVTDNPIIFGDTMEGISGGNFHGQPMALSFDFMAIALSELANISERRLERLVNPALSGLPAYLVENGGVNSGFMIVQYSAASLVSENKVLSHPASVDSIPSSANQEDHVSMGTIAARKAGEIMKNVRRVLSMEMMCACQGMDLRGDKGMGIGTQPAYDTIRAICPKLDKDRPLYEDINRCEQTIIDGTLVKNVEDKVGEIQF
ncbi:MAG: histidine ammonia-lyase [Lachnospiraceae bacterium]